MKTISIGRPTVSCEGLPASEDKRPYFSSAVRKATTASSTSSGWTSVRRVLASTSASRSDTSIPPRPERTGSHRARAGIPARSSGHLRGCGWLRCAGQVSHEPLRLFEPSQLLGQRQRSQSAKLPRIVSIPAPIPAVLLPVVTHRWPRAATPSASQCPIDPGAARLAASTATGLPVR